MRILKVINPCFMDTDYVCIDADQIASYYYDTKTKRTKIFMNNGEHYTAKGDVVNQITTYMKGPGPVPTVISVNED